MLKSSANNRWIIPIALFCAVPLSAQIVSEPAENMPGSDYQDSSFLSSNSAISGIYQLPEISKTEANISNQDSVLVNQDIFTLISRQSNKRSLDNVVDTSVLDSTSAYRTAAKIKLKVSSTQATDISKGLAEISAAYKKPAEPSTDPDCDSVAISVKHRVNMDTSTVLEIVEAEISANPKCACEIVKTAITASGADIELVASITEVAITASPESMRMISQCAIAAMPEALSAVQAVLAKLDPNRGDSYSSKSAKSAKDAKDAVASDITPPEKPADPLDLPPPPYPTPFPPPPNEPDPITDPNP